jgi:uncharacterized membrane protein
VNTPNCIATSLRAAISALCWIALVSIASAVEFIPLGVISGDRSKASALSGDGSTVVGSSSYSPFTQTDSAFRWTEETGMQWLRSADGFKHLGQATVVSSDGKSIAGWVSANDNTSRSVRWTADNVMLPIESVPPLGGTAGWSRPLAISGDGQVMAFRKFQNPVGSPHVTELFLLNASGQLMPVEIRPAIDGAHYTVGETFVTSPTGTALYGEGARWTQRPDETWQRVDSFWLRWQDANAPPEIVAIEPSGLSINEFELYDVSQDGSTFVGSAYIWPDDNPRYVAYRWTEEMGLTEIGEGIATSVSGDGSIVVGKVQRGPYDVVPWIWDAEHGMRTFAEAFNLAEELSNWAGSGITHEGRPQGPHISDDGRSIAATGYREIPANSETRPKYEAYLIKLDVPDPSRWMLDGNANWSANANWTLGIPNASGARALLGKVITSPRTVTLDVPVTIESLELDSVNSYTLSGVNTLTLAATSANAKITVANGNHTISAPLTLRENTVITVRPGTGHLAIMGPINADGATVMKAGGGTLTVNNLRAASLQINGGTVAIAPNGTTAGTSILSSLSIAIDATPSVKLDLVNNSLILNYNGPSPANSVRSDILSGRGGPGLGAPWTGQGITSSAAATANAAEPESRSIGYAENSALPLGPYTTFHGQPVDSTSVLIAYTRTGDANLDGVVNDDDVTIVGATYAPGVPQSHWALGDFDYNGFVDDDDVTLLGAFYDPNAAPLIAAAPAETTAVTAIPEPATWALLVAAIVVISLREMKHAFSRGARGLQPSGATVANFARAETAKHGL